LFRVPRAVLRHSREMNNMKGLGSALPNPKGGKGKAAAAEEEDDDEEFDPSQLSASERAELAKLVKGGLTSNPELIKALQGRLDGLVGRNSGYIDSLPSKARARRLRKRRFGGNARGDARRRWRRRSAVWRVAARAHSALARARRRCAPGRRAGPRCAGAARP